MSAAKRLSPAASLLRHSRLMAMPAPVPSPPSYFVTNPDVSPHPVVQSITTPPSSHSRGNWGLKRDLPTKTKYPFLRYTALDTLEHFTTYESAADDVLTLKKWQEMDVPILKGPAIDHTLASHSYALRETVFDGIPGEDTETYKWRYDGPYLPDMPAGEFKRYVTDKIKPRREEFIAYVTAHRQTWTEEGGSFGDTLEARPPLQRSRAEGERHPSGPPQQQQQQQPEPQQEQKPLEPVDIRALRADSYLLRSLVMRFLDLPFYSRPHRTHPSGGLYYTRSGAHVRNDPVDGPGPGAKVVSGRNMNHQSSTGALVGIGGIVAKATDAGRLEDTARVYNNRYQVKKYVPGTAKLDALGRILLDVDSAGDGTTQGAYGGFRSLGYASRGLTGESAADLLKNMGGGGRFTRVYDSVSGLASEGRTGRPAPTAENQKQMDDVMDLLAGTTFSR